MSEHMSKQEFLRLAGELYDQIAQPKPAETFDQIEQQAVQAGKELTGHLMEARLRREDQQAQAHAQAVRCPRCQKPMRLQDPAARRRLRTTAAQVEYRRAHWVCDGCGFSFSPGGPKASDTGARPERSVSEGRVRLQHRRIV